MRGNTRQRSGLTINSQSLRVRAVVSWPKKKPKACGLGLGYGAWRFPTFARQSAALSSALGGFTSGFGMGPGGSRPLWSPSSSVSSRPKSQGRRLSPLLPLAGFFATLLGRPAFCFRRFFPPFALAHPTETCTFFSRFAPLTSRAGLRPVFFPSPLGVIGSSLTGN